MKKFVLIFLIGIGVLALILYFTFASKTPAPATPAPVPQLPAAPAKKDPLSPITPIDTSSSSLSHPVGWSGDGVSSDQVTQDTSSTYDSHTDIHSGYTVTYPTSWPVLVSSSQAFMLQNSKTAVLRSDGSMGSGDSIMSVASLTTPYATIEDFVKDPKGGLSPEKTKERLAQIKQMTIGGKSMHVLVETSDTSSTYIFIYNKLFFTVGLQSGSKAQFTIDKKTFADFVTSFTLL